MKSVSRFLITQILAAKSKSVLKRHRTQIIAITGSIGKTSTKEAIYHIVGRHFKAHHSPKGFNTELGLSLSVLQEDASGFSSIKAWLGILKRAFAKRKLSYNKIVLEMGADKPGDIRKLTKIARPNIAVITNVNPVHLEKGQFKDLDDIRNEKATLIADLKPEDVAILNFDDPLVKTMPTKARIFSFGTSPEVDVRASDVESTNKGVKFTVTHKTETANFAVPVLGAFQIYTLLPAIAVGLTLGLKLKDCVTALRDFQLPNSRMNSIPGIRHSTIIDSSYNASPTTMARALELLKELKADRKIAALGTMNELGDRTKEAHLLLGANAAKSADIVVAVGQEAAIIKQGAVEAGMPDKQIYTFFSSDEAGAFLKDFLLPNDLVLVKGSQNRVRMERLVKIIMENPDMAGQLLCRQDKAWEKI
jgi:UDP-N-acetylmuramoyl-tripeptide--D-alanyl-D-alanine ligase